jgi:hypothetical protein
MLNNAKIQNPNEQNIKTGNSVIARSSIHRGDEAILKVLNLGHLKFEFV